MACRAYDPSNDGQTGDKAGRLAPGREMVFFVADSAGNLEENQSIAK
jgi:hypothetical protein